MKVLVKTPKVLAFLLCGVFLFGSKTEAATLLHSYTATSTPSSQSWSTTASSQVTGELVVDRGTAAWKLTDSTLATGTNYVNYSKTILDLDYDLMMSQGWEFSVRMRMADHIDTPLNTEAWNVERNVFAAVVLKNGTTERWHYGLNFGRDAEGRAMVGVNGMTGMKVIGTGYHDYVLRYDSSAKIIQFFIDGEYWKDVTPTVLSAGASHQVTWGDNFGQSEARAPRISYFESLKLSIVPEPSQCMLAVFAIGSLLLIRRRTS